MISIALRMIEIQRAVTLTVFVSPVYRIQPALQAFWFVITKPNDIDYLFKISEIRITVLKYKAFGVLHFIEFN
jgi:hypothetical protein